MMLESTQCDEEEEEDDDDEDDDSGYEVPNAATVSTVSSSTTRL